MASGESGNLWFLQANKQDPDSNQQIPPPPASYQSPNTTNPFNKVTQSPPPQDGSAYSTPQSGYTQPPPYTLQQGSPYPPPQQGPPYAQQQGSPYPQQQGSPYPQKQGGPYSPPQQGTPHPQQQASPYPQQNVYAQSGPHSPPQQGYPPQQGSPYPQQGYPQQGYGQSPQRQFSDPGSQNSGEASSFYGMGPPPVVQPGPGPGGPGDRGFFDSAMQIAGVQQPPPGPDGVERGWFSSSKNPLDPPPKMFKRPAPGHYAYIIFRPVSVLAVSEKLQDGFALMPPVTAPGDPHPFTSHDVTEEDWHKFLKDFQKTAHLSPSDRLFQGMSNSFMKDKIPSAKVQQRMAENKLEPIGDYLMAWNHYFFRPRRMTVVLAKGSYRFSGEIDDYPPDLSKKSSKEKKEKKGKKSCRKNRSAELPLVTAAEPYPRGSLIGNLLNPIHKTIHETTMTVAMAPHQALYGTRQGSFSGSSRGSRRNSDSDSDSSSSSSESDDPMSRRNDFMSQRKQMMGERRGDRRCRREERKRERRERKHGKVKESTVDIPSGRFRLILCYWDGHREVF